MVGPTGFEPATSRPPDERATRLRYGPTMGNRYSMKNKRKEGLFLLSKGFS